MSFAGTPLGQGRRLDHNTFLGKQPPPGARPPSPHRIVPTSYSYGAPTLESRSPPRQRTTSLSRNQEDVDNDDNNTDSSALAKFAKIKQREALASRPGGPKIITSPPKPDKWAVKDTSVNLASALHNAAQGNMLPAVNPNNAWASGVTRPNPIVPRSTSVEYEKETQTTTSRRLAPPPNRLSRPPPVRKPLSKNASVHLVPDSEGEEDTSGAAAANGRGKSPFEHVVDIAKKALGPATYYVRQLSQEPEDRSSTANRNTNQNRDTSYDYTAEEQEYQASQQAKRTSLSAQPQPHKRGRMSMDNRAYKPTESDFETDGDSSDDGKPKKRRKKKKDGAVGGPLTTLPVLSADKRKKRKSKGTKSGIAGVDDEDEGSESDEPSVELESHQTQQRSSVPRFLPPPGPRGSAPPQDTSINDSSLESAEQGLDSIPEVPEEDLSETPRKREQKQEAQSRRMPRSSSRPPRDSAGRFSIGGLLGRLVHGFIKGLLMIVRFVLYLVTSLFFACGRVSGALYDTLLNRPALWLRAANLSPAAVLARYLTLSVFLFGVWYTLQGVDITSHLPSFSLTQPSSRPIFTAPDAPATDITELADRMQRIEIALSRLSHDSERTGAKVDDGVRSYSELLGRLASVEDRLVSETKRAAESDLKLKDALAVGKTVNAVKHEIEVLQAQILAQEKQRQQEERHRPTTEQASDEEARARLRALEEHLKTIEGGVREAVDLSKKAISNSQKSVTVKAPGGQDMKALVSDLVDSAISLYSKDTIGKVDYAMHSNGARVIPSLTSPSFEIQPPTLRTQLLGFITGNGYAVGRPPVTALHHEAHGGYCWPFAGQQGQLGVSLAAPTIVDEVTIDHVAKENALDLRSAPRYLEVWGMIEGEENAQKYLEMKAEQEKKWEEAKERGEEVVEEEEVYPTTLPQDPPYIRIANFTYDIESSKNVQTFPISQEIRDKNMDFGIVVLRVLSNWGKEEFSCLYRFRVHGTRLSPMPIPEPVEDVGL